MFEDGSGKPVSSLLVIPGERPLLELKYRDGSLVRRHNCNDTMTKTTQCPKMVVESQFHRCR